jgi:hypothetical protein
MSVGQRELMRKVKHKVDRRQIGCIFTVVVGKLQQVDQALKRNSLKL